MSVAIDPNIKKKVTIDPNIKKKRIFINKNGEKITEEQMFGGVANELGGNPGANRSQQKEE